MGSFNKKAKEDGMAEQNTVERKISVRKEKNKNEIKEESENKFEIKISVRSLVEFIMRSGDIDNRITGQMSLDAMAEGAKIHRKIQGKMGVEYKAEVPLRMNVDYDEFNIRLEGRADGIITDESGVTIDEIKGMYKDVQKMKEPIEVHRAQAMCYACIYASQNSLSTISVQMTYCNLEDESVKRFKTEYTYEEVCVYFKNIIDQYVEWARYIYKEKQLRKASVINLAFPFEYRKGQRDIVVSVYKTIKNKSTLFVQAPTGVGKTISTVFPAVHAVGEDIADKIFYLTAKTITRTVAEEAFETLRQNGLHFKTVTITAKEKICSNYVDEEKDEKISRQRNEWNDGYEYAGSFDFDGQNSEDVEEVQETEEQEADKQEADNKKINAAEKSDTTEKVDALKKKHVVECNPLRCSRAKGHFDRINDAIFDIITHENMITRDEILRYANKHNVCPFEMSLDISNFMDGVICDYNYVFDPHARLKRYFSDGAKDDYIFLVDEAHNLVERAREMYSAVLVKEDFLKCKKIVKGKSKQVYNAFEKCNKEMLALKQQCTGEQAGCSYTIVYETEELVKQLLRLSQALEKFLDDNKEFPGREEILNEYFNVRNYLDVYELVDEKYEIYSDFNENGEFFVKLFCVNPSGNLSECMQQGISTIFFSATLLPVNYYKELLSGNTNDYAIYIDSPFDTSKRLLAVARDVSSKYTRRGREEYTRILNYIDEIVSACQGNYMVFFPSYKLMDEVYELAVEYELTEKYDIICQRSGMDEKQREEFLSKFNDNNFGNVEYSLESLEYRNDDNRKSMLGFCVLGGIFSEGIDLKNERLIGSIIVGTGLPQVCSEREILKNHYDKSGNNGFDYAYRYPGMNKVLQAAGRVIRTSEDYGVIALLDERFLQNSYRAMFPREWCDFKVTDIKSLKEYVEKFWKYV